MADIHKIGALCIRDKKLLIVHKKGLQCYISLGGKIEQGEKEIDCLQREVKEETGCGVKDAKHFGTFEGNTEEGKTIWQSCYLCELEGEITLNPKDTVDEYLWIDKDYDKKWIKLAPLLGQKIVPKLIEKGLL